MADLNNENLQKHVQSIIDEYVHQNYNYPIELQGELRLRGENVENAPIIIPVKGGLFTSDLPTDSNNIPESLKFDFKKLLDQAFIKSGAKDDWENWLAEVGITGRPDRVEFSMGIREQRDNRNAVNWEGETFIIYRDFEDFNNDLALIRV